MASKKVRMNVKDLEIPPFSRNRNARPEPSKIGDYVLGKTIGHGSFAKVKLATHKHSNSQVAVKIVDKKSLRDAGDHERLRREVTLTKVLRHPNIATVYEVLEAEDRLYMVSEYASGGELFDYIVAHGRCPEHVARKFFRQMFAGIWFCHQNFIIHRDLKPENLLLDAQQNIKVVDFGFSNVYKPDSMLQTYCGSPAYAAPEMIAGRQYIGPEVDIWSLGVILYALLCGFLPFDSNNMHTLYQLVLKGKYDEPSILPVRARDLIRRMLVVDVKKRATHDEIRNHPWVNEGEPAPVQWPTMAQQISVHQDVVDQIEHLIDVDKDELLADLQAGSQTRGTAAYYILLDKQRREVSASKSHLARTPIAPRKTLIERMHQQNAARHAERTRPAKDGGGRASLPPVVPTPQIAVKPPSHTAISAATATPPNATHQAHQHGHGPHRSPVAGALADSARSRSPSPSGPGVGAPRYASPNQYRPRRPSAMNPDGIEAFHKQKKRQQDESKGSDDGRKKMLPLMMKEAGIRDEGLRKQAVLQAVVDTAEKTPQNAAEDSKLVSKARERARNPKFSFRAQSAGVQRAFEGAKDDSKEGSGTGALKAALAKLKIRDKTRGRGQSLDKRAGQELAARVREQAKTDGLREVKGAFAADTTSQMAATRVLDVAKTALTSIGINYTGDAEHNFLLNCTDKRTNVRFELEICQLSDITMNGVRLKRLNGDTWAYKQICRKLASQLKL